MVRLRDAGISPFYRTGTHDLVKDFYRPCLEASVHYDRAVGYFSSTSLAAASAGLKPFISRPDARMRLIASPALSDEDIEAIEAGLDLRDVVRAAVDRQIAKDVPSGAAQRLQLLTWLIANDRLDLRLAVVHNDQRYGIYHEKLGIFSDGYDHVVYTGSANETKSGLLANFESVEVFRSWDAGETERVQRRRDDFENLWQDRTVGLRVLTFPEASQRELLERYEPSLAGDDTEWHDPGSTNTAPTIPTHVELRGYQKEAIRSWWDNNGHGIWEMATGTGKTFTALAALTKLWEVTKGERSLAVVVTVPFQHLADQWFTEAKTFGFSPILAYESKARWSEQLDAEFATLNSRTDQLVFVIAVNATFASRSFQDRLAPLRCAVAIVADEAHTAGAEKMLNALPEHAQYRLGLSATPDRHMDDDGTARLRGYFGSTVYQLGLKAAIELGALVPYRYYPVVVELTDDELDEYVELSRKIVSVLVHNSDPDPDTSSDALKMLLFKRARLIGSAANKVPALRTVLEPHRRDPYTLVYCSDRDHSADSPQLEQVIQLMGHELGMHANTFTSEEDRSTRKELLQRFASADLQALVAIRCLDEGVDVPATRRAFILASSQNPRQFVQRRGRVLRRAEGKDHAEIYDFLVSPPDLSDDRSIFDMERRLVGRELMRAMELCGASLNPAESLEALRPLRQRYDLMSMVPD